jgi:hypothetical protein
VFFKKIIFFEMEELATQQLNRQNFVDNPIFDLLQKLNPTSVGIAWDIEKIGEI